MGTMAAVTRKMQQVQELGRGVLERGEGVTSSDLEAAHKNLDNEMEWTVTQSWNITKSAVRQACKPGWERAERSLRQRENRHR